MIGLLLFPLKCHGLYWGGTNYRGGLIDELAIYGSVLPMSLQKGYIGGEIILWID